MAPNVTKIIIDSITNSILKNIAIEENDDELDNDDTALTTEKSIFNFEKRAKEKVINNAVSDDDFKAIFGYSAKKADTPPPPAPTPNDSTEVPAKRTPKKTKTQEKIGTPEQEELKAKGEAYGRRLFKYLDGLNGCSALNGFDLFGLFGDDGHEKANDMFEKIDDDTNPLIIASFVNKFNKLSKFKEDNEKGICKFMMDESWNNEEECVQKITNKVLQMCKELQSEGAWSLNSTDREAYNMLIEISDDKDVLEEFDDDSETMQTLDIFVSKISNLYVEKFGSG